ncbi:DUF3086 domain-containing protein [Leptothermofonsia sp. ETS-13]|uniref:DUF3086 domain-containing protein n=1 Tax=Leptothermofonsia sp. ETS-13 TaxID=3035696 RepID=UPI003B9DF60F
MNPDESTAFQPDEPEEQSAKPFQPSSQWDEPSTSTEPEDPWLESLGENEFASSEPTPPTTDGEELPLLVLPKIGKNPVEPLPKTTPVSDEEPFASSSTPTSNPLIAPLGPANPAQVGELEQRIDELQRQERSLKQEIEALEATHAQLRGQIAEVQGSLGRLVQEGLKELEQRKQSLQISIEQLERRQERIRAEMKTTFAGVSQDLAIRVQSFKDYLVGSLQDLALAAEQLELPKPSKQPPKPTATVDNEIPQTSPTPKFAEQSFHEQTRKIRNLLDQYRNRPDYYGPPWHLRRTFEPIHAERVSNWFFTQGGRGAIRTMGSRLQNILVASATISILHSLYGDRLRALILAESPERLGEWRRGLQDCLGITRSDFGPERGVALFEDPELMVQKADRSLKDGFLPFIIIDETEEQISLSILQFPLWLAFAPNPQVPSSYPREW